MDTGKAKKPIPNVYKNTYINSPKDKLLVSKTSYINIDIEDENSWVELTPGITRVKGPSIFEPNIAPKRLNKYKF